MKTKAVQASRENILHVLNGIMVVSLTWSLFKHSQTTAIRFIVALAKSERDEARHKLFRRKNSSSYRRSEKLPRDRSKMNE